MKINGIEVSGPHELVLPLPRGEQIIEFRARAIPDYAEFDKLCPQPQPPTVQTPTGTKLDWDSEDYVKDLKIHSNRRSAWIVVKSLEPSNIEWVTVRLDKPSTWMKFEQEFKDAGFNIHEINKIVDLVLEVNCLDESKIEHARQVFARGQEALKALTSSPTSEPQNTPSGDPAQE